MRLKGECNMNKKEWLESLKKDQRNRTGLGMYVLDSFNEEIAGLYENE